MKKPSVSRVLSSLRSAIIPLVLVLAAFSLPSSAFAYTWTTAGSLDSLTTDQGGAISVTGPTVAAFWQTYSWAYQPGASHNICSASIIVSNGGSTTTDALHMDLRLGSTSTSGVDFAAQGTLVKQADAAFQIRDHSNQVYTYTFTPCAVVVGASWYQFVVYRDVASSTAYYQIVNRATGTPTQTGTAHWITQRTKYDGTNFRDSSPASGQMADIIINGGENFSAFDPSNTGTTTSSIAPTCSNTDFFSYTICYLFTPSQTSLSQFSTLSPLVAARAPFSYVSEFATMAAAMTTSTTTAPTFRVNFAATTIGSSTPFGNVLPDVKVDNAAIQTFLTPAIYSLLMIFQGVVIWVGALMYVYRRVVNFKFS